MPNTCSVFGCKTNYRGHPTGTVFSLPIGSKYLKEKWIRPLHRDLAEDLPEDKYSFAYTILGRKILSAPIYRPNAVPVIFQAGPSYLNTTGQIAKRLNLESKEEENFAKALHDSIIQDQQDSLRFGLGNLEDLKIKVPELHLNQDWAIWYPSSNTLEIIHLEFANQPLHILSTLSIHSDLTVSAVVANTKFL
ncbi:hypothetical protein LOD99_6460 [Oopsacas minuta]|uniref:THAP-type domain-containing protein n=1 Tax=Oopsacas minuta TaxID=111878 RepID=A0AAV7JMB1_9METZ|nr:hypothetical protein LOD99_6460 [Oopsacas minuta]